MTKSASRPPVVPFRRSEPLQHYYNDGQGNCYSVAKLLDDAKDLPVFEMPLAGLDLNYEIWRGSNMFELADHVRRVMKADLDTPILLDWNGGIADGRHRVIKALALGKRIVLARRMTWRPEPDRKEESNDDAR